eukprot:GHVS01084937.1.p1 GENE.GHVS01084937.1~~GHVS01084937.1.p1  ORF type:complete len:825 (+),score=121.16 GHVS01084937.1:350-2824(+)
MTTLRQSAATRGAALLGSCCRGSFLPSCCCRGCGGSGSSDEQQDYSSSSSQEVCTRSSACTVVSGVCWGWGWTTRPHKQKLPYYITEFLNGLIICFAQVPESIAFSFMANVSPSVGLHAAWIMGLCASIMGGRPGIINGATGAFAAVIGGFVTRSCTEGECVYGGIERLFVSLLIAGLLIIIFGFLRLGKLVQLIPTCVMIGFCNGLAIVIGVAQLHPFHEEPTETHSVVESSSDTNGWVTGWEAFWMSLLCICAMLTMELWQKVPKIGRVIPASLLAMVFAVCIEFAMIRNIPNPSAYPGSSSPYFRTKTIGDVSSFTKEPAFPQLFFLNNNYSMAELSSELATWTGWQALLSQAVALAAVGILEELMTIEVVNDLLGNKGVPDQQMFGMGVGNMICGIFGTMGGNSMIGLSVMNCRAGGKGKESAVVSALGVFAMMAGLSFVLNYIPIAALSGIMFVVVIHTFQWYSIPMVLSSFLPQCIRKRHRLLERKINRWDAVIIVIVTVLCPLTNLAVAAGAGICLAALVFCWVSMTKFSVRTGYDACSDTKYYGLEGSLFFGSKMKFESVFDADGDPNEVIVVLKGHSSIFDYSALEALNGIRKRYKEKGKNLKIVGISAGCLKMTVKANHLLRHMDETMLDVDVPHIPKLYQADAKGRLVYSSEADMAFFRESVKHRRDPSSSPSDGATVVTKGNNHMGAPDDCLSSNHTVTAAGGGGGGGRAWTGVDDKGISDYPCTSSEGKASSPISHSMQLSSPPSEQQQQAPDSNATTRVDCGGHEAVVAELNVRHVIDPVRRTEEDVVVEEANMAEELAVGVDLTDTANT